MELGNLGVWNTSGPFDAKGLAEFAQLLESLGYAALWYPESRDHESFTVGGFILAHTTTLIAATGIANIYARDPTTAKQGQHTINKFHGGRFLLGLGVSHIPMVEGARGHTYGKPVATMRAYLEGMEKAAAMAPPLDPPPPTVIAALGPRMTALAAERGVGVHPYNVTPEGTQRARDILGPDGWVCTEQKVLLLKDASRAREVAREGMARYMTLPNYRNNWLRLGFKEEELEGGGSDRFLDAMVAWGDETTIRARIQEHFDAGASHVCIQPLHPDGGALPHLDAVRALAPK